MIRNLKRNKFFIRVFSIILCSGLLIMISSILIMYNVAKDQITESVLREQYKTLIQFDVNFTNMNAQYSNLCLSMYYSPDVTALMFSEALTPADEIRYINNISKNYVIIYPSLNSVYIRNHKTGKIYTTHNLPYGSIDHMFEFFDSNAEQPKLKPVLNVLEGGTGGNMAVFSYFMFDDTMKGEFSPGILLNHNANWLIDSFRAINWSKQAFEEIFFVSPDGEVILEQGQKNEEPVKQAIAKEFVAMRTDAGTEKIGFYYFDADDSRYIVSYLDFGLSGAILYLQKYNDIFANLKVITNFTFLSIAMFSLAITAVASLLSINLYRPVKRLMHDVVAYTHAAAADPGYHDEFEYLADAYRKIHEKLEEGESSANPEEALLHYYIGSLLICSDNKNINALMSYSPEHFLFRSGAKSLRVVLIQIDDMRRMIQDGKWTAELLQLAVSNVALECLRKHWDAEIVKIRDDTLAAILCDCKDIGEFVSVINTVNGFISHHFHFTLTIAYSLPFSKINRLTFHYEQALSYLKYRFVYGYSSVIDPVRCERSEKNPIMGFDERTGKKLTEALYVSDRAVAEELLLDIIGEIVLLRYPNIVIAMLKLFVLIKDAVAQLNEFRSRIINIDFDAFYKEIMESDTIDACYRHFSRMTDTVMDNNKLLENEKSHLLIATAQEYINQYYTDPNLNAQKIADAIAVSKRSLSKQFMTEMHTSIADFITNLRLQKAAMMLVSTERSIEEVAIQVGIDNSNYFYKLFKKKYGLTPREYKLHSLSMKLTSNMK